MSAGRQSITQLLKRDVKPELREVGITALRFWGRTTMWVVIVSVLTLIIVLMTNRRPTNTAFFSA